MPECGLSDPFRVVVMVSGEGTTLQSLIDEVHAPGGAIEIVRVIASKPDAGGLARALAAGIATRVVALNGRTREERDTELGDVVAEARPDLVVMAGWMSIVTGTFLGRFPDRVINLHPSLLPAFPGMHAIEDAIAWGVRFTGVTVHFAEEVVDAGPPIVQEPVPVLYGDSPEAVRERIREVEHRLVPLAVTLFAQGRVRRDRDNRRMVEVQGD
jgi:phosphoribosylglycinamide formyltransferase 1